MQRLIRQFSLKIVVLGAFIMAALVPANSQLTFAASPQVVGAAPATQNSIELVGKIDQTALAFNGYGYLTYISGVPAEAMFTDPVNHSEATAHFTFVTTANLTARSVIETIFVLNAAGTTTVYYNEKPKASFKDAKSFAGGTVIASGPERLQSVVNVQAPDTGILTAIGEYNQTTANPFSFNGKDYVLGNANQALRYSLTGEGKRTNKLAPNSTFVIAGYATAGG